MGVSASDAVATPDITATDMIIVVRELNFIVAREAKA